MPGHPLFLCGPERGDARRIRNVREHADGHVSAMTGDKFMKSMLRPIPPAAVFQLLQTGGLQRCCCASAWEPSTAAKRVSR
jgi:hypothetical protein